MVRVLLDAGADVNNSVSATDSGLVVQCTGCGRTFEPSPFQEGTDGTGTAPGAKRRVECPYCSQFNDIADSGGIIELIFG